jgi:hypothetical protein
MNAARLNVPEMSEYTAGYAKSSPVPGFRERTADKKF